MKDAAQRFLRLMLPMVTLNFERDGHVMPVLFLLMHRDENTGALLEKPNLAIVPMPWTSAEEKLVLFDSARSLARERRASMSLLVCESWYVEDAKENIDKIRAHMAEHGTLEGYENCRERVSALLEYADTAEMWHAPISRNPTSLGEFQIDSEAGVQCILNKGLDNATLTN
jgi:hypothetical protein